MNMECNVHDTITHSGRGVLLLQTDEFFTVFLSVLFLFCIDYVLVTINVTRTLLPKIGR